MKPMRLLWWLVFAMPISLLAQATGNFSTNTTSDLTQLSLAELMSIPVTITRTPAKISDTPAAITVITGDEIHRSGVTSIPDALRTVPGMEVARVDAHTWAVTSRGFNDVFANKLLVMIDGRTIYTPLFSGVFWDMQDVMLEDIDRIEVIRGPGASLWGANAVNGVINIVTKSAKDTQGGLFSAGTGTEELLFGNFRYGAKLNDETYVRIYGKYFNRDDQKLPSGADANDAGELAQGGFRIDWEPGDINFLTLQGDIYAGVFNNTFLFPTFSPPFATAIADDLEVHGGNILGRWAHSFSDRSESRLQVYYDDTIRNTPVFSEERGTFDIDFVQSLECGNNLTLFGAGYRRTSDESEGTINVFLFPEDRTTDLFSGFIQDEFAILPDKLSITAGSKFEHNDFTGFEIQPSVRLLWTPQERHSVWAAVSRAVRTPSRAEDDVILNMPGRPPGNRTLFGTDSFDSESLIAYEVGYRFQPTDRLNFDSAAFYNVYDSLRSLRPLSLAPDSPRIAANELEGETYGFELSSTFQASDWWRLHGGYTYLQMQMHPTGLDSMTERLVENASPHHQLFLRSSMDFGRRYDFGSQFQFDTTLRYVDAITVSRTRIPSYWALDLRLAWRPDKHWEFAIVGQSLLDNQHPEFAPNFIATQQTEVERSVYAKVTWHF